MEQESEGAPGEAVAETTEAAAETTRRLADTVLRYLPDPTHEQILS